eukprot:CAMPEP_0184300170 /NCGR_PEP_ID=MMETSP1049-20130417/10640_1 /TAXON_ID=77928 /ORGANISM="Proteomonas sulcata, Strain CCMP704" /LENGTH=60 /DNA_ID=CAMNT_0026610821 /DNA_START=38 /DNA_END=216 /DNA_ORIENTATION=+
MSKLGRLKPLTPLVRSDSHNIKTQNPPNHLSPENNGSHVQPEPPQSGEAPQPQDPGPQIV